MNRKYVYIIIFLFLIFLLFFMKRDFESEKNIKDNIIKSENNIFILNIEDGFVLKNNFEFTGKILKPELFKVKSRDIVLVLLTDKKGNMLGRKYLQQDIKDKSLFHGDFQYNQTKEKEGVLEIKNITDDENDKVYIYRVKVKLDNQPLNLNANFVPLDGSPFVGIPTSDPPINGIVK